MGEREKRERHGASGGRAGERQRVEKRVIGSAGEERGDDFSSRSTAGRLFLVSADPRRVVTAGTHAGFTSEMTFGDVFLFSFSLSRNGERVGPRRDVFMYPDNDGASSVARSGDATTTTTTADARPRRSRVCLPTAAAESGRTCDGLIIL